MDKFNKAVLMDPWFLVGMFSVNRNTGFLLTKPKPKMAAKMALCKMQ